MKKNESTRELSNEGMRKYGYEVVDAVVEHFATQHDKNPVVTGSRAEMDNLFLEEAPEEGNDPHQVLDFVLEKVIAKSTIVSHPKSFSFVPEPSNYINAMRILC